MINIESLLSARLFLQPQIVGNRIYFISNLTGHLSLYSILEGGSIPEPLLPPQIALQNPHLLDGTSFFVCEQLGKIFLVLDKDGDENYRLSSISIEGGYPDDILENKLSGYRVYLTEFDPDELILYFTAESIEKPLYITYQFSLKTGELIKIAESLWGIFVNGYQKDHISVVMIEGYSSGDHVLYSWKRGFERQLLYGIPIETREPGQSVPLSSFNSIHQLTNQNAITFTTTLFDDKGGLGYLNLENPEKVMSIKVVGIQHEGSGELIGFTHLHDNKYILTYNIDGCSWIYSGTFIENLMIFQIEQILVGTGNLSNGVLESLFYDKNSNRITLSFSTATSPTQIYLLEGDEWQRKIRITNEKLLGIPNTLLSQGEDASFLSFDGMRISARLYLPVESLNYKKPYPLVYYIHGGPNSQERPDFAWFSMPLIQFLTLKGFAVFVPNVRGSSGYGLNYMKQVDRDWGGKDRLDHVFVMTSVLPKDDRLNIQKTGVVGRSYGGYMTLILASRHPELWSASVDMFGPYNLITFSERIPESWKPYFRVATGDPIIDRDFLLERSPSTYMGNISCPLLVIQGKNDPRVIEQESRDLVNELEHKGKNVDILIFENEGHDVLKYENRVICYSRITAWFEKFLK
jgi:pimeloyl-ACP methyl ester carboxylesterase